jgi:hypothetical protein
VNTDGIKYLPNAFYDMIVFAVPTVQFVVGICIGWHDFNICWISHIKNASPSFILVIIMMGIVASYEYGRLAEALSAYLVQGLLEIIVKKTFWSKVVKSEHKEDFLRERNDIYDVLELEKPYDSRIGNKWAIYFFAFNKNPSIGADLLKRYAWEKLSRSSAFTYALLILISILSIVYNLIDTHSYSFRFGSSQYIIGCFIMTILTYLEYYRRNIWNHVLLTKVIPILKGQRKRCILEE